VPAKHKPADGDVERLLDQAVEQGFSRHCSDPLVMSRVAGALTGHDLRRPTQRARVRAAA
jgi:hypothetical protein